MASLGYDAAWAKSQDPGFRNRLRVAMIRHAQYQIQRSQNSGETELRYVALQNLGRVVLGQIQQREWTTNAGLYVLLPWGSFDDTDDEALDARIAATFPELGAAKIPE